MRTPANSLAGLAAARARRVIRPRDGSRVRSARANTRRFDCRSRDAMPPSTARVVTPRSAAAPAFSAGRPLGSANVALRLDETTCDACHRDPHAGKYAASAAQGSCATCHDTRAFRPSTIDAEAHSRFALEGAHRAAPCVACHTTMKASSLGRTAAESPTFIGDVETKVGSAPTSTAFTTVSPVLGRTGGSSSWAMPRT